MKKTLLPTILTIGLLVVGNMPFVGQGSSNNMAPPPPITPTPTDIPLFHTGTTQGNPTPPTPGKFQAQVEQARAHQAMEAALAKYLRYWGPRYRIATIEVAVEGEWAHGIAQWESEAKTLSGPLHILAHRSADGTWQASLPGSDELYLQWLDIVPESLVSANEKSQLRIQVAEADALRKPQVMPAVLTATATLSVQEEMGGFPVVFQQQAQPTITPTLGPFEVSVDYTGWEEYVDANIQTAIIEELNKHLDLLPPANMYVLTAFNVSADGNWARAVVLPKHIFDEGMEGLTSSDIIELLIKKEDNGNIWRAYLFNTSEFLEIKSSVPRNFIDFSQTYETISSSIASIEEYRFPWSYGRRWWKNGGWHSGSWGLPNNAIDFQSQSNSDVQVLAATKGLLNTVCDRPDDPYQVWLKTTNADGTTGYGHIDKNSINRSLLGQEIPRGTHIGNVYNPGYNYNTPCGYGSTRHLHFVFPTRDICMYDLEKQRCIPASEIGIDTGIGNISYTSNNQLNTGSCGITSIPSGYNKCADEGGRCNFSGTANVIYGANNCYTAPRSFSNGVDCNNNVFGDPVFGVQKHCYTDASIDGTWAYQLFDLGDFNGDKFESNQTIANLSSVGWNDRAESIKIGAGYEIIACQHADFQGICGHATGPAQFSDINALAQGLRNELSSIKACVGACPAPCTPTADQVALYADTGYGGSCVTLGVGDYPNPGYLGSLGNDSAESIRVGSNVQAVLCEHDNYQGRCETFTSEDPNLGDNTIGANVVSSVKVQTRPQPRPDLVPSLWSGWEYPIVPSSVRNTTMVNTLYADHPTYVDWGVSNRGNADAGADVYGELYLDSTRLARYNFGNVKAGETWAFFDWQVTVTSGWHTLRFIADPDNLVAETDESNNAWERAFYWNHVTGWWGEYFNNLNLADAPVLVRDDPTVNFSWAYDSPGPGVYTDNFSVRWTRSLVFLSGIYEFAITHDDGARLWVDDTLVLDQWSTCCRTDTARVFLTSGPHSLKIEMFDSGGAAVAQLSWRKISQETYLPLVLRNYP